MPRPPGPSARLPSMAPLPPLLVPQAGARGRDVHVSEVMLAREQLLQWTLHLFLSRQVDWSDAVSHASMFSLTWFSVVFRV